MSVSVVPHRAHVVASPQRRPLGRPTAISTQQAAPRGTQTPAAYDNVALGLIYNGVSSRSLRHPSPTDRDFHSAGGVLRHADARDVHRATAPFGTQTPAAGFAPPTRHARPLIFSPHATYRRQISSYKFLLSPSLFPVAAPIGPPLRAVGHRPAGTGAVCSSFLSAPRRRDSNGPFFHLQVLPVLVAPPAPPSGHRLRDAAPSAARRPFPHDLRRAVPGIPTVRRLSASIHPLHSPHRPCPKIIVLRSASL